MADDLASVLTRTVRDGASAIASRELAVRDGADDSVHQMRVSVRTLRSVVQVLAPLLDPDADADRTLRRLGRRLSHARDTEVVHELVRDRLAHLPPAVADRVGARPRKRLKQRAAAEQATAAGRLRSAMDSPQHADDLAAVAALPTTLRLVDGLEPARLADAETTVTPFLLGRMDLVEAMTAAALAADDPDQITRLHEARKAAKRARYAVTALRDAGLDLGPDVADRLAAAKHLHRALGDHRDSVLVGDFVLRVARRARAKGEDTFGYGVLWARELATQEAAVEAVRRPAGQA